MKRFDSSIHIHRSLDRASRSHRAGFSIWDLLAVLFILIVLIAVITPAVQTPRPAARRMACLNNIKNIALGVHNYATTHDGVLPPLDDGTYGWPIQILPQLDAAAIYRQYTGRTGSRKEPIWLQVLTCPKDERNHRAPMGLSYVANAGYGNFTVNSKTGAITEVGTHTADIDWNDDGTIDESDRAVSRASGLFWRPHEDGFEMTLDYIEQSDGMGQTIMLTENLNARNWASRETMDIAFVIGRDALGTSTTSENRGPLQVHASSLGSFGINRNNGALPGQSPVPSSNHVGQVHVAFCDGRVQSMSDSIDPRVYARLMTPDGETFGQSKIAPNEY